MLILYTDYYQVSMYVSSLTFHWKFNTLLSWDQFSLILT